MSDILDEIEEKKTGKIFSILSVIFALVTLGLFGYLTSQLSIFSPTIRASEGIPAPPLATVRMTHLACLAGVVFAALSFIRKEPSSWYKWVGGVLNLLFFMLIVSLILFTRAVEG